MSEIASLLADMESFRVQRIESLTDSDKFCKAICAFANDMPGSGLSDFLFVGVDRTGKPTGAKIDEQLLERLASHRNNGQILPVPDMHVFKTNHNGKEIAVIEVRPSDVPPSGVMVVVVQFPRPSRL
jgi:ATP-dependent DNA helicase RecG